MPSRYIGCYRSTRLTSGTGDWIRSSYWLAPYRLAIAKWEQRTPEGHNQPLFLNGTRERCERGDARNGQESPFHLRKPAQRAVRASRTVEVGREWRVGTRSGFGRPGGPGFFGGAVAVAKRCQDMSRSTISVLFLYPIALITTVVFRVVDLSCHGRV